MYKDIYIFASTKTTFVKKTKFGVSMPSRRGEGCEYLGI
jgi:hypothetical protein